MTGGYWGNVLLDVSEKTRDTLWPRETSNKGFLRQAATTSGLKHFRIRSPGMAPARESYGCPSHQPPEETDLLLKQKLQRWFSGRAVFGTFPRGQWGNWAIPCPLFPFQENHDWYCSLFTSQLVFEAFIIAASWGWQHFRYQGEVALVLLTHVIPCVVSCCCCSSRTLLIPVLLDWNLGNSSGISNGCFNLCFKKRMRPCFWMVFIVDSYSMNGSYQWIVHSNGKPSKTTAKYGQTAKPMRFCSIHQ